MLKHKTIVDFSERFPDVYLKSSNFKRVGMVNLFKSIYKTLKRGEEVTKKFFRGLVDLG